LGSENKTQAKVTFVATLREETVFIIIPVYNEDPDVLLEVISHFAEYQIILVDDGSEIPMVNSLRSFQIPKNIHYAWHHKNCGQGLALKTGVDLAITLGGTVFCTMDADGQHDAESCKEIILAYLNNDVDIILGSRFQKRGSKVPFIKKIFLKGGIFVNYIYSGIWLRDAHCGLRVFGIPFAQKMKFYNGREAHASEILWIIKRYGFSFAEFPVKVIYTSYSRNKGQSVLNSFWIIFDLLKHRFSLLTNSKKRRR